MRLPSTMDEYEELVEQALIEAEDLRRSAEFDEGEEWGEVFAFLDVLEMELRRLQQSMLNGTYRFADEDLPFMRAIAQVDTFLLPFKSLLETINLTHRSGLSEAGD
jgi:hypothetical protein